MSLDPVASDIYVPDLYGFKEVVPNLPIRHKQGGETTLGKVIRPNQTKFLERVEQYRREKRIIRWFEIKIRQFVSLSTVTGAVFTGDTMTNPGWHTIVTAHEQGSLDQIDLLYKYFFGRTKKRGKEQGRAARFADYMYESPNGSLIELQMGNEDLARSGALTGLHVSEAHYIENFAAAWQSAQPAMATAYWSMVIMETTMDRGVSNTFRDIVIDAKKGKFPPWDVHFSSWLDVPELSVSNMTPAQVDELAATLTEYEKMLRQKHKCSWGRIQWHRNTRIGGMFGNLEAMIEAYPTDFDEAMKVGIGVEFFQRDAMAFHAANCRDPIERYTVTHKGLTKMAAEENRMDPHVEMWEPPSYGAEYIIGADCADADERLTVEGSENYAVVVNKDTGDMVAQWHGYTSSHEFAQVLVALAARYNRALINPEYNNAGKAVMDALRVTFRYTNLAPRERFQYGVAQDIVPGVFGFDTRGTTRQLLLDRLQQAVNRRLFSIPSAGLMEQLKAFGNRNGRKVARRGKAKDVVIPDDGCIALALTCFGHGRMANNYWLPKAPYVPPITEVGERVRVPGYLVSHDDRVRRKLRFNERMNCWVRG